MPQAALALTQALLEPPGNLPGGHLELINALQRKRGKADLAEADVLARPIRLTGDQLTCLFTRFPREELESLARQIGEGGGPLLSAHITDDRPIGTFYAAAVTSEDGGRWLDTFALGAILEYSMTTSAPFAVRLSLFKKQEYLRSFSENAFRDQVIRPLFLYKGMKDGRDFCGPTEEGKDYIFVHYDPLGD